MTQPTIPETAPDASAPAPRRDQAAARVVGSAAAWFLFTLNLTLLYSVSSAMLNLSGECTGRSGIDCPATIAVFAPLSLLGGVFAVVVAFILARGFGTSLLALAWPALFGGFAVSFFLAFAGSGDQLALLVGVVLAAAAVAPLLIELRGSVQRVFLGTVNLYGMRFRERAGARRSLVSPTEPNPEGAITPRASDWALSIGIILVAVPAGAILAWVWFLAS